MTTVATVPCKSALSISTLPGLRYAFNPYVGCQHGCLYCYVPDVLKNRAISSSWGQKVQVKGGIIERLGEDLRRNPRGVVGVSTVTDPYQPAEKALEITREALSMLQQYRFPVSIQTKSSLLIRDLDIIKGDLFEVGITITSLNGEFCRLFEPGASPPDERIQALEEVSSQNVNIWIFYGPIIPGFNDSSVNIERIINLAERTKSKIIYDRLNIKPLMSERIRKILSTDQIKNIKYHDFAESFRKIESLCKKQGVHCQFAF